MQQQQQWRRLSVTAVGLGATTASAVADGDEGGSRPCWGAPTPVLPLWPTASAVPLGALPPGEDPEAWMSVKQQDGTVVTPPEAAGMRRWFEVAPAWVHTWRGPHNPALQVFEPPAQVERTGAAVIVCPGGGYRFMAPHEGFTVARWLAEHGVTAFVLRYRLQPHYSFPAPLLDLQRAVRYVRHHKAMWALDGRVAALGFSAGGHLVCAASTVREAQIIGTPDAVDAESADLDFAVPIYPCTQYLPVDDERGKWNPGSAGKNKLFATEEDMAIYNPNTAVTTGNPPTFLVHSTGDTLLTPEIHSDIYAAALLRVGTSCEYIRSEWGGHGVGLHVAWGPRCLEWLNEMSPSFVKPKAIGQEFKYPG
eukprot:SAG31_NODE_5614_length_2423_cov_2.744836_2_plen_365_part_00